MRQENNKKALIMVPYASGVDGISVNLKNKKNSFDIYMKNCCCALVTAKHYNPDCDVALVTNVGEVPREYSEILKKAGILILTVPFKYFLFPENGAWRLAFYKLCALATVIEEYPEYEFLSYIDSDCIVQDSFHSIWECCADSIMLYDLCQGLQVPDYVLFNEECKAYQKIANTNCKIAYFTRFGGEFFAADVASAKTFVNACKNIFNKMLECKFRTTKGDEFISSIAANELKEVRGGGAYVFRFWTGSFRLISTTYKNQAVTVIHVPGEKEKGMLKLYRHYIRHGKFPSKNTTWRYLHILFPSFSTLAKMMGKTILKRK